MAHRIIFSASILAGLLFLNSCQTGGFGRADMDHDGLLNYDEFSAASVGKHSSDAGAAFIAADGDRDGALSSNEFQVYVSTHTGR